MNKSNIKGFKLTTINWVIIAISIALSLALIYIGAVTGNAYENLTMATNDYIAFQQNANDVQTGSDYLTEQVRAFVVTGEKVYVDNYFKEAEVTRRRDLAVETIRNYKQTAEQDIKQLNRALSLSNELMYREYYAIRLAVEGRGYDVSQYQKAIQDVHLSEADLAMSPEEMAEAARIMMFDDIYQNYKDQISSNVNEVINDGLQRIVLLQNESLENFHRILEVLNWVITVFIITMVLFILYIRQEIIDPLRNNVKYINDKEVLPLNGAYEVQFLSETYNRMFEQNMLDNTKLSYEATHDALTGLYNRKVFDNMRDKDIENYTMIYMDIDYFKQVNDTYGHEIGDKILQKMAAALHKNFRSEDFPCRIGGDEFAVIMVNVNSNLKHLVSKKVENVNSIMHDTSDGLPECSISCGIAFPDRKDPTGDIYKDADIALYKAKEAGRNNYKIY